MMPRLRTLLLVAALGAFPSARAYDLITVDFSGEMSAVERQTFLDAASFWNSVVTGFKGADYDGLGIPATHALTITAEIKAIDGVNGVLGQAGPSNLAYFDNNPLGAPTFSRYYTSTGAMTFDSADTALLVANNSFYGVVLHEMGHVLGLGTLWGINSTTDGIVGNPMYDPASADLGTFNGESVGKYTGQHALAAWQSEFGQTGATYVPVEKGGAEGTVDGHWNEFDGGFVSAGPLSSKTGLDFSQELMTGWASGTFFLSDVTLGSLEDLGYDVDYTKSGVIDHVVAVPEASWLVPAAALPALMTVFRRMRAKRRVA